MTKRRIAKQATAFLLIAVILVVNIGFAVPAAMANALPVPPDPPSQQDIQNIINIADYMNKAGALEEKIAQGGIVGTALIKAKEILAVMKANIAAAGVSVSKVAKVTSTLALVGVLIEMQDWGAYWDAAFNNEKFMSSYVEMPNMFSSWVVNFSKVDDWVNSFVKFSGIEAAGEGFVEWNYIELTRSGWQSIHDWADNLFNKAMGKWSASVPNLPGVYFGVSYPGMPVGLSNYVIVSDNNVKRFYIYDLANIASLQVEKGTYDRIFLQGSRHQYEYVVGENFEWKRYTLQSGTYSIAVDLRYFERIIRSTVPIYNIDGTPFLNQYAPPFADLDRLPLTLPPLPIPPGEVEPNQDGDIKIYIPTIPDAGSKSELEKFYERNKSLDQIPELVANYEPEPMPEPSPSAEPSPEPSPEPSEEPIEETEHPGLFDWLFDVIVKALKAVFIPEAGFFENQVTTLSTSLSDHFGTDEYLGMLGEIKDAGGDESKPPQDYTADYYFWGVGTIEGKYLEIKPFDDTHNMIHNLIRAVMSVLLILFNINQIYRLFNRGARLTSNVRTEAAKDVKGGYKK